MNGLRLRQLHQVLVDLPRIAKESPVSSGLSAKILYLRWTVIRHQPSRWMKVSKMLDVIIDTCIDRSGTIPLSCQYVLSTVSDAFAKTKTSLSAANNIDIKNIIDRAIERLAKRGSGKACLETKVNVLRVLFQIVMRILQWRSPVMPR
jgi:hypothetical protein